MKKQSNQAKNEAAQKEFDEIILNSFTGDTPSSSADTQSESTDTLSESILDYNFDFTYAVDVVENIDYNSNTGVVILELDMPVIAEFDEFFEEEEYRQKNLVFLPFRKLEHIYKFVKLQQAQEEFNKTKI